MFRNKKVLITGGAGSIGWELVRQLLPFNPDVIRIFSRDEYKQFEMEQVFGQSDKLRFLLGDVRDKERLSYAFKDIDYIFHLAAYKQVPACEYNPFEAIQTNVIGTQNVIKAALDNKVKKVLLTSTDKAVIPTNTMGASKLIAERLFVAAQNYRGSGETNFTTVRFGNVIGSKGSVIPLFLKQIISEKRVRITHPDMLRFMMSVSQACQLMIEAMMHSLGGEIFVLKMPIIRLGDLVEAIMDVAVERLSVKKADIQIDIIGLRPGEKMFEELLSKEEAFMAKEQENMFIISPKLVNEGTTPTPIPEKCYHALQGQTLSVQQIKEMIEQEISHFHID